MAWTQSSLLKSVPFLDFFNGHRDGADVLYLLHYDSDLLHNCQLNLWFCSSLFLLTLICLMITGVSVFCGGVSLGSKG